MMSDSTANMKSQVQCSQVTPVLSVLCTLQPPHERHIINTDPLLLTTSNGTTLPPHGTKDIRSCIIWNADRKYKWSSDVPKCPNPFSVLIF